MRKNKMRLFPYALDAPGVVREIDQVGMIL